MICSDCTLRMVPFFICTRGGKLRQLKDKSTELTGCNIDGKMTLPDGSVHVAFPPNRRQEHE